MVAGSGIQNSSYIRVYSFKIITESGLARDFIPCYRISDNEVGLYDLVNDVFYINKGTGNFVQGAQS